MTSYCDVAPGDPWHGPYHDAEYGFPLTGDDELFERLMLEVNQAGLSWLTILKKRDNFRHAYHGFDPERVARYGARDVRRLLGDAGIIRNRLKIAAAIANARTVLAMRESHGGFHQWLLAHQPGVVTMDAGSRGGASSSPTSAEARSRRGRSSGGHRETGLGTGPPDAGSRRERATHSPQHAAPTRPADAREHWVKLFRKTFRFTGGEIVNEFLLSTGWLPGAHRESCPVYPRVVKARPMWVEGD